MRRIAGTKKFVESLGQSAGSEDAMNLIGQFGVGFYSGLVEHLN